MRQSQSIPRPLGLLGEQNSMQSILLHAICWVDPLATTALIWECTDVQLCSQVFPVAQVADEQEQRRQLLHQVIKKLLYKSETHVIRARQHMSRKGTSKLIEASRDTSNEWNFLVMGFMGQLPEMICCSCSNKIPSNSIKQLEPGFWYHMPGFAMQSFDASLTSILATPTCTETAHGDGKRRAEEITAGTGAAGITGGGNHDRSAVISTGVLSIIWPGLWWDHVCLTDVANMSKMWQHGPIGFLFFLWVAHGLPCLDHNLQDAVGPWERCRSHTLPMCCIFRVLCMRTHGTGTGARLEGTSTQKFCQAARNVCELVWVCIALVSLVLCFYRTYMA